MALPPGGLRRWGEEVWVHREAATGARKCAMEELVGLNKKRCGGFIGGDKAQIMTPICPICIAQQPARLPRFQLLEFQAGQDIPSLEAV